MEGSGDCRQAEGMDPGEGARRRDSAVSSPGPSSVRAALQTLPEGKGET